MAFRALAVPWCPLIPLRVLDYLLWSCLLRFLLTLALHFLSLDGLEVFRNIDQMSSSRRVCSIFLIIAWDHRFEGEDYRRKVPFSQCLKGCAASMCHAVWTWNTCGVLRCECSVAGKQEREKTVRAGTENYLGHTSIRMYPWSSVWSLPPSQLTFGARADPACYMCSWFIWTCHVSVLYILKRDDCSSEMF